jgi:D-3-phosphoglycerate dehydrogenase
MRILVVGDSFCAADAFRPAFAALSDHHQVTYVDVADDPAWSPRTPSEQRLKETFGTPGAVIAALDGHQVLVLQGAPVTDAVLDAAPLRLVCCARGGPVNVDLEAATERGIPVSITPGKNADAVAELTVAFMVMLARRLPEVMRHVESGGEFGHDNYEGRHWFGHDLAGKTLGLVGVGQVGRRVATRAQALEMRVVAHDPFVQPAAFAALGVEPMDLSRLLATSDFVSLHARASADNRHLIDANALSRMKRGAYLVNTARDTLLDERAAAGALTRGQLAGLALDLVSPSPADGRHPLLAFPNVIITTHVGGATFETLHHAAEMAVAEIERLDAGQPLANVANAAGLAGKAGELA